MSNSLGKLFVFTCFGESHGKYIAALVDGCPAGLSLSVDDIQKEVDKRKPHEVGGTGRRESDKVEIISGLFNGFTTGAPICLIVENKDIDSSSYEKMKFTPRPGHADYPAYIKYGGFNDYRGGGRFSGRVTVAFVMAGVIAKKLLNILDIDIVAHTVQIGVIKAVTTSFDKAKQNVHRNALKCADLKAAKNMERLIKRISSDGDSVGGIIEVIAKNLPVGLGEPVFDTLEGDIAKAFFSIPGVKGVEFGSGFSSASKLGSENNDAYIAKKNRIVAETNNAGGILGGLSNGMHLLARVAIKPTASISLEQKSVDIRTMEHEDLLIKGRHDTCIVPRAVPVVEAMTALVLCDFSLREGLIKKVIE